MIGRGIKIALALVTTLSGAQAQPGTYQGFSVYYPAGLFERVAANRHMAPASCMAATSRLPLGRWIDVLGQRTGVRRRCRVLDICQPSDCPALRRRRIVVELDELSSLAVCGHLNEPARKCPVTVYEVQP